LEVVNIVEDLEPELLMTGAELFEFVAEVGSNTGVIGLPT
jgi:hypothetical protein